MPERKEMSAYSDYKCGAISYEDYAFIANREAKVDMDRFYGIADDDDEEEEEDDDDTV